jgi:hypothetical protein
MSEQLVERINEWMGTPNANEARDKQAAIMLLDEARKELTQLREALARQTEENERQAALLDEWEQVIASFQRVSSETARRARPRDRRERRTPRWRFRNALGRGATACADPKRRDPPVSPGDAGRVATRRRRLAHGAWLRGSSHAVRGGIGAVGVAIVAIVRGEGVNRWRWKRAWSWPVRKIWSGSKSIGTP